MTTSLIVRRDTVANKTLAFVADSINRGQMLAWAGKGEPEIVGVDQYHNTAPVPAHEAEQMAKQYAKTFGDEVHIRQRLPRDYMLGAAQYKSMPRPNANKARAAKMMQEKASGQRAKRITPEVRALAEQLLALVGKH